MYRFNQNFFPADSQQHYYYCILVALMARAHSKHTAARVIVRSAQSQLMNPIGRKGDEKKNYRPFDGPQWLALGHPPRDTPRIDRQSVHWLQSRFSLSRAGRWRVRAARIVDVSCVRRVERKLLVSELACLVRTWKETSAPNWASATR